MGVKRSIVEILHDDGYGDDLLWHINKAFNGKDMRAESVLDNLGFRVSQNTDTRPSNTFMKSYLSIAARDQTMQRIIRALAVDVQAIIDKWLSSKGVTTENANDFQFEMIYPYRSNSQMSYRLIDVDKKAVSSLVINLATLPPTALIDP